MDMFTVYKEIDDLKAEIVRGLKDKKAHPELVLITTTLDTLKQKLQLKEEQYLEEMNKHYNPGDER